jgi:hypothetical protein
MATITRTPWIDDDGSGTTGTVINNAEKTTLYNQIDAALAAVSPTAPTTWTPTDRSGAGLTFTGATALYVRLGPLVFLTLTMAYPVTATGQSALFSVPILPLAGTYFAGFMGYTDVGQPITVMVDFTAPGGMYLCSVAGGILSNAQLSGKALRFMAVYFTAAP